MASPPHDALSRSGPVIAGPGRAIPPSRRPEDIPSPPATSPAADTGVALLDHGCTEKKTREPIRMGNKIVAGARSSGAVGMGVWLLLLCLLPIGCASKVDYGDATAVETLTVDFGSTDLQMIAEKMVRSLLSSPVIQQGHLPVVQVGRIRNRTDEHIDTKAIADKIRTALLQSGKVRFTAKDFRREMLDELAYQAYSGAVDPATAKRIGRLTGADYLLAGQITSIRKKAGRKTDLYFQITLNLVDLETGLLAWAEEKEIRKEAKRPLVGW